MQSLASWEKTTVGMVTNEGTQDKPPHTMGASNSATSNLKAAFVVTTPLHSWSHQEDGAVVVHVQERQLPPRLLQDDKHRVHEVQHLFSSAMGWTITGRNEGGRQQCLGVVPHWNKMVDSPHYIQQ